jgi:hypothetical protein
MDSKIFTLGLRTISAVMPYAKKLEDDEAQFLWLTLDSRIKTEISNEMWTYAVKNYLEGKVRNDDLPVHMDVLSIFIKQRNCIPHLDWGFRCNAEEFLQGLQLQASDPYNTCPIILASNLAEGRLRLEAQTRHERQVQFLSAASQSAIEETSDFLGLGGGPCAI